MLLPSWDEGAAGWVSWGVGRGKWVKLINEKKCHVHMVRDP